MFKVIKIVFDSKSLVSILICCLIFNTSLFSQESKFHNLYNKGYYSSSINKLKNELNHTKNNRNKIDIYYDIAMSYYGMSFVEIYKKYIDSAYQLVQKQEDYSYIDKVTYGIAMIRYYNFEIKPSKSLEIYNEIYPIFHKNDPNRLSKLWISLYQNIATTRRNTNEDYCIKNAEYDSAYFLLKKHNLLNTVEELNYCKSRGNMNLDNVSTTSNSMFYEQAIYYYERGLQIINETDLKNEPLKVTFQCLEGLVSYMRGEFDISKRYYDLAFLTIDESDRHGYSMNDIKSIYLNVVNWSTFTMSLIYQKKRDINLIK